MAAPNQPPNGTRKSVTGFITKLVGDGGTFGFINDEIFFQQDVVIGGPVALNDRVFADCEYSESLPIKWNATSIKITQRANASPSSSGAPTGPPSILDSDPRRRQGLLNQQQTSSPQQQQPPPPQSQQSVPPPSQFNQAPNQPVANTYQQHRQQRLQQQQQQQQQAPGQIIRPFETGPNDPMGHQQRLMEVQPPPPSVVANDFFQNQPFAQPPVVPQAQLDIPPFQQQQQQLDTPMGPPKITYTSQLGAAFVQGQAPMVPPPYMAQATSVPPPSMLPTNNQQQHQNQRMNKQGNNRFGGNMNQSNNNKNMNDQDNNNVRNRNRADGNRSDHQRDSRNSQQTDRGSYNSRSDSSSSSRDRSGARNASPRRDNNNSNSNSRSSNRCSPPSHHPIRSRGSVSSERSGARASSKGSSTSGKRHYEVHNIPKSKILTNLNGWNMRSRCSSSIHVPSDLKDVIVNKHFRLDVKNTPKPIRYKIEEPAKSSAAAAAAASEASVPVKEHQSNTKDTQQQQATPVGETLAPTTTTTATTTTTELSESSNDCAPLEAEPNNKERSGSETSSSQLITPPSSQPKPSDVKMMHKYGVKVVLLSMPDLGAIYKQVFGQELDSYANDSATPKTRPRLDEAISLLCNRGPQGGHSLIGGKFDPTLDGFVEGQHNELERHGRQPDLIATCRRVVQDSVGLDLGPCKSWILLSTFMYNHKSDYFSPKASVEYSFIYMPQIWTMACSPVAPPIKLDHETASGLEGQQIVGDSGEQRPILLGAQQLDSVCVEKADVKQEQMVAVEELKEPVPEAEEQQQQQQLEPAMEVAAAAAAAGLSIDNLANLKVVDLKAELEKRQVAFKPNAKKAELVALLHEILILAQAAPQQAALVAENGQEAAMEEKEEIIGANVCQAEVAKVEPMEQRGEPDDGCKMDTSAQLAQVAGAELPPPLAEQVDSNKRKAPDDETAPTISDNNKSNESQSAQVASGGAGDDEHRGQVERETIASGEPEVAAHLQPKGEANNKVKRQKVELISEAFVVRAREGQQQLTVVPLYEVVQVSRYDQFELSVVSNLLKESLVQHLSEYIFTALVESDSARLGTKSASSLMAPNSNGLSETLISTNSDTNNNNNNNSAKAAKGPTTQQDTAAAAAATAAAVELKEFPVDRYINLACAYFDSTHMGHLQADDLSKLFNNTGLTISKRALNSLLHEQEKFNYRTLADLSPRSSSAGHVYTYPEQFSHLPTSGGDDTIGAAGLDKQQPSMAGANQTRMVEFQGVNYDLASLVREARERESARVNMCERFNHAIETYDKQADEIHVLEVNQRTLAGAIKSQSDEIGELKRERDLLKKKLDSLRKGIKSSASSLNELLLLGAKEEK